MARLSLRKDLFVASMKYKVKFKFYFTDVL